MWLEESLADCGFRHVFCIAGWPSEGVYRCTKGMFIKVLLRGGLTICAIVECELELPVTARQHLQIGFSSDAFFLHVGFFSVESYASSSCVQRLLII